MRIDLPQIEEAQREICKRHGAAFERSSPEAMSGMATATRGELPVNGLRHPSTGKTTGWFLWFGEELSEDADFFKPVCTRHIYEEQPEIAPLLGLPPGYRFLRAGGYLDVWIDATLLDV